MDDTKTLSDYGLTGVRSNIAKAQSPSTIGLSLKYVIYGDYYCNNYEKKFLFIN